VPYGGSHDHHDPAHHAGLSTPNFQVLGWDPLITDYHDATSGGYFCGEIGERDDGRRLAVTASYSTDVAFVIVDVTDPTAPFMVGEYVLPYAMTYDVAMTPDATHVLVGTNAGDTESDSGSPLALGDGIRGKLVQPRFRDACTGQERPVGPEQMLPLAPATLLVDITDPENPRLQDAVPAPILGVHSVSTGVLSGNRTVIASSITNLVHAASYFQFFTLSETPLGTKLKLEGVYQAPPSLATEVPVINGHVDASFMTHPVTGQDLAYLANWDAGLVILDVTNMAAPQELSRFSEFTGGLGYMAGVETGNLHETLPLPGLWDGRHYVLAGQEILSHPPDHPTGWVWILDDTDPTAPELVGRWTLPVDVEWDESLQFSTHYVAVVDRTLFVSLYHGGVWAVDLSTPELMADPPSIGVFIPDRVTPAPYRTGPSHGVVGAPTVLDVLAYPDGTLVVFDAVSGAYTLRFDAANPAPAPPTWGNE
jgi:hypothetical protein